VIEASHEPLVKVDDILLPPSDSTYKYQKVCQFVVDRKNITTSSLTQGEKSTSGNMHGAITFHIHNSSKSSASLLTS
jgi:hypothetical protein